MAASVARMMASLSLGASGAREARFAQFQGLRAGAKAAPPAAARAAGRVQSGRGRLVIRAARVAGVEIPNNKLIEISLQYVYGVGPTTAKAILAATGLENKRTRELTEEELTLIRDETNKYQVEGDLRRFNAMAIKRLKDIQCLRGKRHIAGLPVRGQRTKTNARTRRGKKVTVAGKKKAPR